MKTALLLLIPLSLMFFVVLIIFREIEDKIDSNSRQLTRIEQTQLEIKAVTDQLGIFDLKKEK